MTIGGKEKSQIFLWCEGRARFSACFNFVSSLWSRQTPELQGVRWIQIILRRCIIFNLLRCVFIPSISSLDLSNMSTPSWLPSLLGCLVYSVLFQYPSLNSAFYLFVYWGRSVPFQNSSLCLLGLLPATSVFEGHRCSEIIHLIKNNPRRLRATPHSGGGGRG